jgi:hypothetical protein
MLHDAAEHLNAGRKDAARDILREALTLDRNNVMTWELLWRAAYTTEEEIFSLKRILSIDPKHVAARKRLAELQPAGVKKSDSQPLSHTSPRRPSRRKRQQASTLLLLLGALVAVVCVSATGFALYRGGYTPFLFSSNLTATALAERNASCQALIDRTIQASDRYCGDTTSNTACYGNNTLKAELVSNTAGRFSERGDVIEVNELRRLSASPLNLDNSEWGIAVFNVIANLPRSLPGETVTMVVFGNATLDNQSGESEGLESFYFSSELGQIVCEKIPFDGLMITSPDGSGIRFAVNGAELTLMGNASIKAVRNGEMEVSVYKGSARIVSNGEEQYFGAGQKSTVQLGGENGTQAISAPSEPEAITGEELTMACTMTGQYCSPGEIDPVTNEQAQAEIQNAITSTPTPITTSTITRTPSPTEPPTYTLVVLPTSTLSPTVTRTPVPTKTPTRTPAPTRAFTPTATVALSKTPTPTPTPIAPSEPICGSVSLSALTNPNPNELGMDITNNNGSTITIKRFFAYWVKLPNSQKIDRLFLNSVMIWNTSDPDSPSDIPTEGNWITGADLTIPDATTRNFLIQFPNFLQPTGYEVHIVFDIDGIPPDDCQVIGTQ